MSHHGQASPPPRTATCSRARHPGSQPGKSTHGTGRGATFVLVKGVKLREWAVREGVRYQTAWRWWRDGKLPVPARQTETGMIVVDVPVPGCAAGAVLYARVSSDDQHADVDRRAARLAGGRVGRGAGRGGGWGGARGGLGGEGEAAEAAPGFVGPVGHGDRCGAPGPAGAFRGGVSGRGFGGAGPPGAGGRWRREG